MQIILHGPSDGGKTTMLLQLMKRNRRKYLITNCLKNFTIKDILVDAFDQLNAFYTSERISKRRKGISAGLFPDLSLMKESKY